MKKIIILGTALLSLSLAASEVQIKVGVDAKRNEIVSASFFGESASFGQGATLGAEYIFDNQGEFEWGIGSEYKFDKKLKYDDEKYKALRTVPVYALGKVNLVTTKKGNDALYLLGRAGYAFNKALGEVRDAGVEVENGLYLAGGVGTELGRFSLEAIYERTATPITSTNSVGGKLNEYNESMGLRLGLRLGNVVNDRSAKIVTRTVEVPVEKVVTKTVEKIVEVPAKSQINNVAVAKNAVLPLSCSTNEKKCVIRGFKVDGRTPNAQEASDLRTIAGVINKFAEGGSIDFVGHTDSTGSDAYNQKLSVARAQNVSKLLQEYGLSNKVSIGAVTGKGETQPSDTNNTVEGRYNNRRVELFFHNVDFTNVNFTN